MTLIQIFLSAFALLVVGFVGMLNIMKNSDHPYDLVWYDEITLYLLLLVMIWGSVGVTITTLMGLLGLFGIHFP